MKVLYLCGGRSFYSNKMGRKIESVVECWRQMGHKILHVCGGDILGEPDSVKASEYGAASFHQQWYRKLRALAPIVHTVSESRDIQHDAAIAQHLEQVCESFKPDLIWERSSRLHSAGLVTAQRLGLPYVLEWKDHLVDYRLSLFRRKALQTERLKNRKADYIVVESGVLRNQLEQGGIDGGKIIVAHNAVEANQFARGGITRARVRNELGLNDEAILVGYLGSYAFYHDTIRLVLAADILRKGTGLGKLKILMVGAGKEYVESRKIAERLGLLDDILIMKQGVPKDEVPDILSALDIAVLPGSTDIICPIKIQEYMSCELPSVVPDYACNREVLCDCDTGVFFKPKDEVALAEKITLLAKNKELRESIGRNAREEVIRRFSWQATWGTALGAVLEKQRAK